MTGRRKNLLGWETAGDFDDGSSGVNIEAPSAILEQPEVADEVDLVRRLYALHRDRLFRLALRYGGNDLGFAEDVTHDVFVRLIEHRRRLSDRDDLGGWLYRVTTNRCLAKLERRRVRARILALWGRPSPDHAIWSSPRIEARSQLTQVFETLATLPPKERVAFSMLHLDGLSQNEIADVLGHSKGYVSKLIHRATQKIRDAGWEVP